MLLYNMYCSPVGPTGFPTSFFCALCCNWELNLRCNILRHPSPPVHNQQSTTSVVLFTVFLSDEGFNWSTIRSDKVWAVTSTINYILEENFRESIPDISELSHSFLYDRVRQPHCRYFSSLFVSPCIPTPWLINSMSQNLIIKLISGYGSARQLPGPDWHGVQGKNWA